MRFTCAIRASNCEWDLSFSSTCSSSYPPAKVKQHGPYHHRIGSLCHKSKVQRETHTPIVGCPFSSLSISILYVLFLSLRENVSFFPSSPRVEFLPQISGLSDKIVNYSIHYLIRKFRSRFDDYRLKSLKGRRRGILPERRVRVKMEEALVSSVTWEGVVANVYGRFDLKDCTVVNGVVEGVAVLGGEGFELLGGG